MSKRILGNVEFIGDRKIVCGWVLAPKTEPIIRVRFDGKIMAETLPHIVRDDIEGSCGRATGFRIELKTPFTFFDVVEGRLSIEAADQFGSEPLDIAAAALDPLRLERAIEILADMAQPVSARLIDELRQARSRIDRLLTLPDMENETTPSALSPIHLPVGLSSNNGSTTVGRDGALFLLRGRSDDVERLYDRTPDRINQAAEAAEAWRSVLSDRETRLGDRYLQLLVPEKQSVQGRLMNPEIHQSTPLFEAVCEIAGASHLPLLEMLKREDLNTPMFRKIDTHLSTDGAEVVARAVCERLGLKAPIRGQEVIVIRDGDLSRDLLRTPVWEACEEIKNLRDTGMPITVESFYPKDREHIGQRHVLRNDRPLHDLKVICFGNSFMDRGQTSGHLTWWFARIFREFHFIWDPEFDHEYIDQLNPDFVFGQTIERYLHRTPRF